MWILASRLIGARWVKNHDCHTHCLGIHRTAGLPCDEADEPVACAAVGAVVDDFGNEDGRRVALVGAGNYAAD